MSPRELLVDPTLFQQEVERITRAILERAEWPELLNQQRLPGGVYYTGYERSGRLTLTVSVGDVPEQKLLAWRTRCAQMISRLSRRPLHLRSSASPILDNEPVGGAVRGSKRIHAFYGYSAEIDELIATVVALRVDDMSERRAFQILGQEKFERYHNLGSWREP